MVAVGAEPIGALDVGGASVKIDGGRAYVEKDWGSKFPKTHVWVQAELQGIVVIIHSLYMVIMPVAVSDYILLTLVLKFCKLLCNFCPIYSCPSRIGQAVEHPNQSQQILVADHHGHPVFQCRLSMCCREGISA